MSNYSNLFEPISLEKFYNKSINKLNSSDCTEMALSIRDNFLTGEVTLWGMPFSLGEKGESNNIVLLKDNPLELKFDKPIKYNYLVFLHTADYKWSKPDEDGIIRPMLGNPRLGEEAAQYILKYADGTEHVISIKKRINISDFKTNWGEVSFECVPHIKPGSDFSNTGEIIRKTQVDYEWGYCQTMSTQAGIYCGFDHGVYAFENPYPEKEISAINLIPKDGAIFFFGLTGGNVSCNPLRWEVRKKMKLTLPASKKHCLYSYENLDIDLGQIISVTPVFDYDNENWSKRYNNQQPKVSENSVVICYTANPSACIYLDIDDKTAIPVSDITKEEKRIKDYSFCSITPDYTKTTVKVVDKKTGKPSPVKIHIHDENGEYVPPMDRARFRFDERTPEYYNYRHFGTYIDGIAEYKMPKGQIYIEIMKGFDVAPIHKSFFVDDNTNEIIIELEYALPWRERGWVTSDAHIHFLSPQTALLEGEAVGANVVSLLATQFGDEFKNVGDFDGKTILGSKENGGSGEYLVNVGTENRQHVLGHISLVGYEGRVIAPITTGGPDESDFGDAIDDTLTNWAKKCHEQNGVVLIAHFPDPRGEAPISIILNEVDAVETVSWGDLYTGITPNFLSDWYRFLNCDYPVGIAGGTDKMASDAAIATVRTYTKIIDKPFTFDAWKLAVKKQNTFATYGPLLEFKVNGQEMGSKIYLEKDGGTVNIEWEVSSVTIPVTKIELIVSGRVRETIELKGSLETNKGQWDIEIDKTEWVAIRVRGHYHDKAEVFVAHSSAVMVYVDNKRCFNQMDAATILEQIEGIIRYVTTIATRAEEKTYKEILKTFFAARNEIHNRLHSENAEHTHLIFDEPGE